MFTEVNRKVFTNGAVFCLQTTDSRPRSFEATATCLPFSTEMRGTGNTDNRAVDWNSGQDFWEEKYMIGISTQSGCPVGCKFCEVTAFTQRQGWESLTAEEMVGQVYWAIKATKRNPCNAKLFRILFTRMGEPATNVVEVLKAVRMLKTTHFPRARIQISTIGTPGIFELIRGLQKIEDDLEDYNWLELQFSIHSTSDDYRRWLQAPWVLPNQLLGKIAAVFYTAHPRKWKVTLNFALAQNAPFDVVQLRRDFDPAHVFVKLLNVNQNRMTARNFVQSLIDLKNVI